MKRFLTRASVAGLSAALVAGVALVAAPAANAAVIGSLTFNSLTTTGSAFTVSTSAGCPAGATNFQAYVTGGSLPATPASFIIPNASGATVGGITTPFTGTAAVTLDQYAVNSGATGGVIAPGTYTMTLFCKTALGTTSLGDFTGQFTVAASGPGAAVSLPLTNVATTTTITSATPATGATNAPATFTATVSPAAAVGTVQFAVDGTNLGAPVTVSGGTATSPATGLLSAATHSVTASFVGGSGGGNQYGNSTATPFSYVVAGVSVTPTVLLGGLTTPITYPATNNATCTVTTAGGAAITAGSVQFKINGVNYGVPIAIGSTGSVALAISQPAGGPYSTVCSYLGASAGGVTYSAIDSTPFVFNVDAATFTPDDQYIRGTIQPGTLTIFTPYTQAVPFNFGNLLIDPTNSFYSATGAFNGITVTDLRPGNLAYTVSAKADSLTGNTGGSINGQNVGLTGLAFGSSNIVPLTAGSITAPVTLPFPTSQNLTVVDNPAANAVSASDAGSLGLGGAVHPIVHANQGFGTTTLNGVLTIKAPTSTIDGTYDGKLTFTILGS